MPGVLSCNDLGVRQKAFPTCRVVSGRSVSGHWRQHTLIICNECESFGLDVLHMLGECKELRAICLVTCEVLERLGGAIADIFDKLSLGGIIYNFFDHVRIMCLVCQNAEGCVYEAHVRDLERRRALIFDDHRN